MGRDEACSVSFVISRSTNRIDPPPRPNRVTVNLGLRQRPHRETPGGKPPAPAADQRPAVVVARSTHSEVRCALSMLPRSARSRDSVDKLAGWCYYCTGGRCVQIDYVYFSTLHDSKA